MRHVNDDVSIPWNDKNTKNLFLDEKNRFTEIREANTEMLSKKVSVISTYGDNIWRGTSESRFSRYKNRINTNNTCGPHAAAVILAYSDDYIDDRIVPSTIRTKGSTSPGNLISKLIQNTTNATATRPTDVSNGMWSIIARSWPLLFSF